MIPYSSDTGFATITLNNTYYSAVFRIRIRRIRKLLGLTYPDPLDPLVIGTDPDPSIITQK